MLKFSQELSKKLSQLNQRKLQKGELVLLAKALADTIPLAPASTESIRQYTLTERSFVNMVIYALNDHTYIDEQASEQILKYIDEFSLWRMNVAYNPPKVLFMGNPNTVIDDLSCLNRYVDTVTLCSIADMVERANTSYSMFVELATETRAQMVAKASE